LPILIEIMVVACDGVRTHVTWRLARPGKSGLRAVVAQKMTTHRAFDDTPKGAT
jgi:hypothetical protein